MENQNIAIINVSGELDLYNIEEYRNRIDKTLNNEKRPVVFDLENLTYIDSTGVGLIIRLFSRLTNENHKHCFINVRGSVNRVFELTRLYGILPVEDSLEDAKKMFEREKEK